MMVRWTSGEHQVNVKSQSELDIGGRETCEFLKPSDQCIAMKHADLFFC